MNYKVYLAGASGYIGSNFLRKYGANLSIVPIIRKTSDFDLRDEKQKVVYYEELASLPTYEAAGEEASMVHLIGCGRETKLNAIYDGNIRSTQYLLQMCKKLGISRIVYVSGYGVTDQTTSVYYRTKAAAESIIRESGLNFAILRCSYIVGYNDELTPLLMQEAKQGVVIIPEDGKYRIQPVFLEDLLKIILLLVTDRRAENGIFNIVGQPVSFRGFVSDIALKVNSDAQIVGEALTNFMREATFHNDPRYSLSELAILIADKVEASTEHLFGVKMTPYSEIIEHILRKGSTL